MGNPTSYLGKTLSWEGKKLAKTEFGSGTSYYYYEYKYDENGLRTRKTLTVPALSLSETTEYFYNGSVLIGMKIGTGNSAKVLRFSYDASGNVAAVDYSANNGSTFATYYYVRNAQNDIVKLIDNSGTAVVEYIYDSWGKVLSTTGTYAGTVGLDQPFRYRGYVCDTETGWYYLQSRYYDPNTCRFISADVLLSTGQGVIGHNSFAYCLNNPVNNADTEGNIPFSTLFGIYVHRAIQDYMIENGVCGVEWYKNVIVDRNRFGKPTWGLVDLVDRDGGAYEIKPANNPLYYYFGMNQLSIYTNASIIDKRPLPFNDLKTGELSFDGLVTVCGKLIRFDCSGDGMIIYYEVEKTADGIVPVVAEVPVPSLSFSYDQRRASSFGAMVGIGCSAGLALGIAMGGGGGNWQYARFRVAW